LSTPFWSESTGVSGPRTTTRCRIVGVERFDAEEHGVRPVDAFETLDDRGPHDRVALDGRADREARALLIAAR